MHGTLQEHLGTVLPAILDGLADEAEGVRDAALAAGRTAVELYAQVSAASTDHFCCAEKITPARLICVAYAPERAPAAATSGGGWHRQRQLADQVTYCCSEYDLVSPASFVQPSLASDGCSSTAGSRLSSSWATYSSRCEYTLLTVINFLC